MRIAVAGLGFMGATHLRAWEQVRGAEVVAVVSSDPRKLAGDLSGAAGNLGKADLRFDFGSMRRLTRLDDALADPAIDIVDLCVPTNLHYELAHAALHAGKHVLVEKPLALEAAEASRLVAAAERSGCVLMVGHVLRFFPEYEWLRQSIARIGPVRQAFFRRRCAAPRWSGWILDPALSGGGVFDLLIHDADIVSSLFGLPSGIVVNGVSDPKLGIDLMQANLSYGNFEVVICGGWHGFGAYPFSMEYTVTGSEGAIEFRNGSSPVLYPATGSEEPMPRTAVDPFVAELAHFHDCAMRGKSSSICPAAESAAAVALIRNLLAARQ